MQECAALRSVYREIRANILQQVEGCGVQATSIPGLKIVCSHRSQEQRFLAKPFVSLLVQGSKTISVGKDTYNYTERQCLIAGVEMPFRVWTLPAAKDNPYLELVLELDKKFISQFTISMPALGRYENKAVKGVNVFAASEELIRSFLTLTSLLSEPDHLQSHAPSVIRQLHSHLLSGNHGLWLKKICFPGSNSHQVAQAVEWMCNNFNQSIPIEELARQMGMSVSSFFRHFKKMTTFSPLQYLKSVRLHEAQSLMLAGYDVSKAAHAVGYESATQFSREYKRLFGDAPYRDINRKLLERQRRR